MSAAQRCHVSAAGAAPSTLPHRSRPSGSEWARRRGAWAGLSQAEHMRAGPLVAPARIAIPQPPCLPKSTQNKENTAGGNECRRQREGEQGGAPPTAAG